MLRRATRVRVLLHATRARVLLRAARVVVLAATRAPVLRRAMMSGGPRMRMGMHPRLMR
jgi:hypothetical protein